MEPVEKRVVLRLKKDKVKINATLSALFSRLSLNPVKTLDQLTQVSKKSHTKVFFVELIVDPSGGFKANLLENPDSFFLRQLVDNNQVSEEKLLQYAKKTMGKSLASSETKRVNQLKGILRSMGVK